MNTRFCGSLGRISRPSIFPLLWAVRGVGGLKAMKDLSTHSRTSAHSCNLQYPAATPLMNQLVRVGTLLVLACFCLSAHAQLGEWAWMGGSSTEYQPGVYGTLGTPAAENIPGGRGGAVSWTDGSGRRWLFGGDGYGADYNYGFLNDLWEFDPSTNEWAWMGGSSTIPVGIDGEPGVCGALGTPAPGNVPGGRDSAASWTDSSGHLWLFGGYGVDCNGNLSWLLNDLWEFNPSSNEWAWMGGSSTVICFPSFDCGQPGVYGTLGTPAPGNVPGSREWAVTWTDSSGHLWLFGGSGFDANGNLGYLNDLWEFDPSLGKYGEWAWMGGSSTGYPSGVWGTLGTPAAGNVPGGRYGAVSWTDSSGNLWLFGGSGYDANGNGGYLNDLWEFNPSTNEWAWIGGSSTLGGSCQYGSCIGQPGVYGALGIPAAGNIPGGRRDAVNWTDSSGNIWLFAGWGYPANGKGGVLNDLWEFYPSLGKYGEWAWMGGSSTLTCDQYGDCAQPGVYGTLGTPAPANTPGSREQAVSWTDGSGNLWLFGGRGYDANYPDWGALNDLWEYAPATAAVPVFNPPGGSYTSVQMVKLSDTTPGATIYYTLDGSTPTTSSQVYRVPIYISGDTTVKAIAVAPGYENSPVASATYDVTFLPAAAPTFSPAPGKYTAAVAVSLGDATPNAEIHYTLDGSTPTTNSQVYRLPIYIGGATTVQAIAVASGYQDSPVASATYDVTLPSAAAPTFSPTPGKYIASVIVSIGDSTPKAIIHYTLDGSTPLSSSSVYKGPLTFTSTTTVKAIATASGYWKSAVSGAQYSVIPAAPTPVLSPSSGSYAPGQTVTISDAIPTATLRYTTDGSTPTTKSTFYTKPILLTGTETINAIAIATGDVVSSVATATYTPQ